MNPHLHFSSFLCSSCVHSCNILPICLFFPLNQTGLREEEKGRKNPHLIDHRLRTGGGVDLLPQAPPPPDGGPGLPERHPERLQPHGQRGQRDDPRYAASTPSPRLSHGVSHPSACTLRTFCWLCVSTVSLRRRSYWHCFLLLNVVSSVVSPGHGKHAFFLNPDRNAWLPLIPFQQWRCFCFFNTEPTD